MIWREKKQESNFWVMKKTAKNIMLGVFILLVFLLADLASAIPNAINYQARLRDNLGAPIIASTTVQFSIYNNLTGGAPTDTPGQSGPLLWTETYDQASGACVKVSPDANGYFTLTLGECVAFPGYLDFSSGTYYLGVKIDTDAEASPRVKLNSHPYALNSDRVDGFHATSTATANQLLALGNDLSFNIGTGSYSGAGISLTSSTATSSISGNLSVIGNSTFATATIDNLILTNPLTLTNLNFTNATGTNLSLTNLTVSGTSTLGIINAGTWQGSIIDPAYGGTGQDTSGWSGFVKLSAGVWSTSTISLTSDVSGILPIANGGTNASSFSPYQFLWFDGSQLTASGFTSSSFLTYGTDDWVDITGDTMTGALIINNDLSVTGTSTLATTSASNLRLGDAYLFPTDAPILVSYKQYTDLTNFEFFPAHAFIVDLLPTADSSSTINSLISLTTNENSTTSFDLIAGTLSQVIHNGSGVVGAAVGSLSVAELASATGSINFAVGVAGQVNNGIENSTYSGTINMAAGVLAMIENGIGGGTIGNAAGLMTNITIDDGFINSAYGARINNPTSNSASGTIGELYGLYIEEQNFATTSNYNIYSGGASSTNYFGGRVGIGTTTPSYNLHVVHNENYNGPLVTFENINNGASSTELMQFKVGNYGGGIGVAGENFSDWGLTNIAGYTALVSGFPGASGNGLALLAGQSGNIIFYSGGYGPPTMDTERMRIENDGRVAIGTSSTFEMLTVAGGINIGATTTPTSTAGTIAFNGTDFIGYTGSSWVSLTAGIGGVTGSGSIGQLSFWDSASSITGTTSLFWDDANGYLGIGTSTPASIFYAVEDNDSWTMAQVHNLNTGPSSTASLIVRVGEDWGGGLFQASPNFSDYGLANLAGYTVLLSGAPDIQSNGLALAATGDGNMIFYAGGNGPPTADVERMRIESNGFVGIGTSTPNYLLDIFSTSSTVDLFRASNGSTGLFTINNNGRVGIGTDVLTGNNRLQINVGSSTPTISAVSSVFEIDSESGDFSDFNFRLSTTGTGSYPAMYFSRSRGTLAVPEISQNNDILGENIFQGYFGTDFQKAATIRATVDGNPTTWAVPGKLSFFTAPDIATGTAPLERMTIRNTGDIGIGTTTPLAKLDIYGDLILSGSDRYLNFNNATGSDGYGLRDNGGRIQFKHESGSWEDLYGKINHIINVAKSGGDFSDIGEAIAFANSSTYDVIVNIYPGIYEVSSTLEITSSYIKGIRGMSLSGVILTPTDALVTAAEPVFDINFTSSSSNFSMSEFTIDGSGASGFKDTTGCDAINISSEGTDWLELEKLYISDVNRGIDLQVANLADIYHVDFYNIGNAGVYIDNGGILQVENSYMEESDTYYAYIDSTTGASEFYMVGSEFGSYNDSGTGLYMAGDNSYSEIRYSNMWGLDNNIVVNDASTVKVTASYLQKALTYNVVQNGDSTVNISSSDGAFSSTDISINNADNVYFYALAEEESTVLFGRHDNIDQDILKVDTGQALLPKLSYRKDYYGNSGLLFINDNPGEETMFGVQATSSWARLSAVSGDRGTGAALLLYSDTEDFGTTSSLRGWAMSRNGADANLIFSFDNSDTGDSKSVVEDNRVMELDGFNTQMLVKGGAIFNTSSGAFDFIVHGDSDDNLLFVQGSSDNIGIGTSTPGYKLTVDGDVNITGAYRINGVSLTTLNPGTLTGQFAYWDGSAWSPTSSVFISSDGKIGIGTTTPLNALSVSGGIYVASGTPANTDFALYNNNGQLYWNGLPVMGGSTSTYIIDSDGDTRVMTENSPDEDYIRFETAGVQRMVIDNNGLIAINTTTQDGRAMYIYGDINSDVTLALHNNNAGVSSTAELALYNDLGKIGGLAGLSSGWNDGLPGISGSLALYSVSDLLLSTMGAGGDIIFDVDPSDEFRSLTIAGVGGANAGYVGIATSSPLAPLDVYGNMILSGDNRYINFGTTTGVAGYGFRDNNGVMELRNINNNLNVWSEIVVGDALLEANVIYVSGESGNDVFSGMSPAKAKKTIGAAITAAAASTTANSTYLVKVAPGTYNENISMADYVRIEGSGRNTVVSGTITSNVNTSTVLEKIRVVSTNDYAIKLTGAGRTNLNNIVVEANYNNDAAVQAAVYQEKGTLYAMGGTSQYKLTRSNDAAGTKINTLFYLSGSNLIRSNILNLEAQVVTYDTTDDLSYIYTDNSNASSVATVKDAVVSFSVYGNPPANFIKYIYHSGASLNSYIDASFLTAVAIFPGTVNFVPAYIANSGSTSTVKITNSTFNWAGAGISENSVYLSAAITDKDQVSLVENSFGTVSDIFPVAYTTDGSSGTIRYFIENGLGNIQNTAFTTYNGSFGIGTSTPYDLLEIWGVDLTSSPTSSRNYITVVANGNGETGNYFRRVNSGGYDNGWSWYMPTSSMDFRLWDDSVGAEGDDVLTVQAGTGNIGIGTALYDPLNKLHVDGGIYLGDTASATSTYSLYNIGGALYWNGNLLMSAGGSAANWILASHNGLNLTTSTSIPVWFQDSVYASSSLYVDGGSYLATTTISNATVGYLVINNTVTTTNLVATGNITLGGVARNTWPSGGGGDSNWATTSASVLYPSLTPPYAVVIGASVTSSDVIFEVAGDSYMSGDLNVGGSLTIDGNFQADYFTAVSTTAISYLGGGMVLGDPNATGITGYERIILSDDIGAFSDFSFKVAGNGYPVFNLGSSGGTTAAPSLTGNNNNLGGLDFYGYDGAAWQKAGGIIGQADGTPGLNNMPGKIVFSTTPTGSATPADRMVIDSRGFVGIGTTTPSAPLHVVTATSGPAMTILQKTIAGATNLNFVTNNNKYWQLSKRDATQDDKFIFYYVNDSGLFTNILTLGATGTVGINNENPNAMLTISGTSTYPLLNIMTSSSATGMYISNIGNVGIGTTDPNYHKLRVYADDSDVSAEVKTASSSKVALFNLKAGGDTNVLQLGYYGSTTPGFAGIPPDSAVFDAVAPGGAYIINEASGAPIVFMTDGWQASNERMRITSDGFVGIGTKTPSTTLSVNGTSTMKNVVPASSLAYDLGNFERNWNRVWATLYNINNQNSLAAIESVASYGPTSTSINGTLSITDPDNPNRTGRYMDSYNIATLFPGIPSGSSVTVSLTSGVFDTYLQIVSDTGSVTYNDDDGGSGTNSYLQFTYDASSTYSIVATSYSSGATGAYNLAVDVVNAALDAGIAFYDAVNGGGNNLLTVLNSGNVGIGTSTPSSVLTLSANKEDMIMVSNSSTNNSLLVGKYLSKNFGMSLETGAQIQYNSYFGEEFMRNRTSLTADTLNGWGDFQQFTTDENTACTWNIVNDVVNGISQQLTGAGSSCLLYHGQALANSHLVFDADNLPVILMKLYPSADSATARLWAGISDLAQAQNSDPTNGIYFTNNTGTGDWRGVTRRGGTSTNVECTGQTINNTVFAIAKIEVVSSTGAGGGSVKFYIDNDTTDGINWTYCGESTTNIPTVGLTSMLMNYSTAAHSLYVDYFRIWQDDSSPEIPSEPEEMKEIPEILSLDERIALLESAFASTTADLTEMKTTLDNQGILAGEQAEQIAEIIDSVNILNVSLDETKSMIAAINDRVIVLEDTAISTEASFADLNLAITDINVRLEAFASSTVGMDFSSGVFGDLFANALIVDSLAIFNGPVNMNKHVTLGEDTVGQAQILAGHSSTTVTFAEPYEILPIISVTPLDFDGKWKLSEVTTSSFKISINEIQYIDITFNWQAFGASPESKIFVSDGTSRLIGLVIVYSPPAEETPVEEPVVEPPAEETPVEEPVVEPPAEETPVEEPVVEPPAEETPVEEPVVEPPAEETPVEEPVVEPPAEETPVEEPVVEPPAEETPVEGGGAE